MAHPYRLEAAGLLLESEVVVMATEQSHTDTLDSYQGGDGVERVAWAGEAMYRSACLA